MFPNTNRNQIQAEKNSFFLICAYISKLIMLKLNFCHLEPIESTLNLKIKVENIQYRTVFEIRTNNWEPKSAFPVILCCTTKIAHIIYKLVKIGCLTNPNNQLINLSSLIDVQGLI